MLYGANGRYHWKKRMVACCGVRFRQCQGLMFRKRIFFESTVIHSCEGKRQRCSEWIICFLALIPAIIHLVKKYHNSSSIKNLKNLEKEKYLSHLLFTPSMLHLCTSIHWVLRQPSNQICCSSLSLCFDRRLNLGLTVGWPPLRACEVVACREGGIAGDPWEIRCQGAVQNV